jgi:hypothetical protein
LGISEREGPCKGSCKIQIRRLKKLLKKRCKNSQITDRIAAIEEGCQEMEGSIVHRKKNVVPRIKKLALSGICMRG